MISTIIQALQTSALNIESIIKEENIQYLDSNNSSGDKQLTIDVKADMIMQKALLELPCIRGICSEEQGKVIDSQFNGAPYFVAYDPLDGSSIIDSNLTVGSIFGIYNNKLHPKSLIASGYVLYGARLEMVFAQEQVLHYRYNGTTWRILGELSLQNRGKINAPGGTQKYWEYKHKTLIDTLFAQGYRLRYSGGMVPDLHQILIKGGGLFSYPATSDAKDGKLRKLFEVFPFAFIFEKAGGQATNGVKRLLELDVNDLHESTPCFFGSEYEISLVKEVYE